MENPQVLVVMGSSSDKETMDKVLEELNKFGIHCVAAISSAHRTPDKTARLASTAIDIGFKVIIAGAGLAAALPGVMAAHTILPVIGVPINAKNSMMDGMDAVGGILQMPPGIPVATVGIDNARNAAVLAAQILALSDDRIAQMLLAYREQWK